MGSHPSDYMNFASEYLNCFMKCGFVDLNDAIKDGSIAELNKVLFPELFQCNNNVQSSQSNETNEMNKSNKDSIPLDGSGLNNNQKPQSKRGEGKEAEAQEKDKEFLRKLGFEITQSPSFQKFNKKISYQKVAHEIRKKNPGFFSRNLERSKERFYYEFDRYPQLFEKEIKEIYQ